MPACLAGLALLYGVMAAPAEEVIALYYVRDTCPYPALGTPPPFSGVFTTDGYADAEGGRRTLEHSAYHTWWVRDRAGLNTDYIVSGDIRAAGSFSVYHRSEIAYPWFFGDPWPILDPDPFHQCGTVISSGVTEDDGPSRINPQRTDAARGDPFNAISGSVHQDTTDALIPAPGLPLAFGRAYNSASGATAFGWGWEISMEWRLAVPANGTNAAQIRVEAPDRRRFLLNKDDDVWRCRRDARLRLRAVADGEWDLDAGDGGASLRFDASGRWKWSDDGWSNRVTATRSGAYDRLTRATHSCGRSLAVEWSDLDSVTGRVIRVKDATATNIQEWVTLADYDYGDSCVYGSPLLTRLVRHGTDESVVTTTYDHDRMDAVLTNRTDALGRRFSHRYDSNTDAPKRCIASGYNDGTMAANSSWSVSNRTVRIAYPSAVGTGRYETVTWHADVPRMTTVEQGGETLSYAYDAATLEPTGRVWQAGAQTAAWRVHLDALGRATNETFTLGTAAAPPGRSVEWHSSLDLPVAEADPLGWRTEYAWTNGLPASVRLSDGAGGWAVTEFAWSHGLPVSVTDPSGRVTAFAFDASGAVTNTVPPVGPAITSSNDCMGRPVRVELPGEGGEPRVWQIARDGFGRPVGVTDPEGISEVRAYDALGRMTNLTDRAGRPTSFVYGPGGKLLNATRVVAEGGSNRVVTLSADYDLQMVPLAVRDSLDRAVESRVLDAAGRIAAVTNIEGRVATVTRGVLGLPLAATRFDGTEAVYTYDDARRLVELALPGVANRFFWLANGLLAAVDDGAAVVTNVWAAPGRLVAQETRANGWTGRVEWRHDPSGILTQTLASAIGLTQSVSLDEGGRETNRTALCGGAQVSASRAYAPWNGLTARVVAGPVEQSFARDRLDRLTNLIWRVQDTPVLEIRYTLDLLGRVTQRVDRSGGITLAVRDYGYDGLDRLASEAHGSGYAATYAYDDAGRRSAKETARFGVAYTAGTGDRLAGWEVTRTNTWTFQVSGFSSEAPATNPAYRFLEARNDVETVAPGMTGSNFTAALTARTLGTQTVIVAISDAAGNVGVATSAFVRTAFTSGEYSADAAGCVTQTVYRGPSCREERTLTWDAQYRLTAAATSGAPAESYGYDPLGRRMWTEAGGVTNFHLYDGAHLLADLDVTGGVVRNYVYGPEIDEMVAMTIHTGDVPRTFYALRDHQNTVWAWVDESGDVVESYDYDAWGRVLGIYDGEGASIVQSAIGNRFLFQGREYSFATGLYQFRARWYDPVTGRWISSDPIGIDGGLNQYVFCGNNPVNFRDPFGLCTDDGYPAFVNPDYAFPVLQKLIPDLYDFLAEPERNFSRWRAEHIGIPVDNFLSDLVGADRLQSFDNFMAFFAEGMALATMTTGGGSWSAARGRYWKAKTGFPTSPRHPVLDVPKELHHIEGRKIPNPHAPANLKEVWPWEHADIDPYRHYNGPRP
ncbi:MAG: RHS repeat-associated core domain-containing protein [Lentisphaerae bacterium]|nr:RHS repeat-associated core domain-containing protein [Lentisphaerota bacterium]